MSKTVLSQVGKLIENGEATKFRVESAIVELKDGDLPSAEIFLHTITAANDPKADKFLRVAKLSDLTSTPRGRESALAQGNTKYLSASFSIEFDDVAVASEGKRVIQSRVDTLIDDYITYSTKFISPTEFEMPSVTDTILEEALAAVKASKQDTAAKQKLYDEAQKTTSDKQTAVDALESDLTSLTSDTIAHSSLMTSLTEASAAEAVFRTAAGVFRTAASTLVADIEGLSPSTEIQTKLTLFENAISTFAAAIKDETYNGKAKLDATNTAMSQHAAEKQAALISTATSKALADAALAQAKTAETVALKALESAKKTEEAAIANAVATCGPTFDPNSI